MTQRDINKHTILTYTNLSSNIIPTHPRTPPQYRHTNTHYIKFSFASVTDRVRLTDTAEILQQTYSSHVSDATAETRMHVEEVRRCTEYTGLAEVNGPHLHN